MKVDIVKAFIKEVRNAADVDAAAGFPGRAGHGSYPADSLFFDSERIAGHWLNTYRRRLLQQLQEAAAG